MYNDVECNVCKLKCEDVALYGEFIRTKSVDVHYYCLLSSYYIPQRGIGNKGGIYGFLVKDIVKNIPKFKENKCFVCAENSAAVKCAEEGCTRKWHYPCGRKGNCITQFIGEFKSYCYQHNPEDNCLKHDGLVYCLVCYQLIKTNNPASCIISKCCVEAPKYFPERPLDTIKVECFTHAECVQRYTVNAGYDASCLNCNMDGTTKDEWQNQMRRRGIFVPEQMAVWENDEYFKLQTKWKCENKDCTIPYITKNVWTCYVCGCFPLHLKCAGVKSHDEYYCPKCFDQSFIKLVPTTSKNTKK
ncbi:PHD finger protein 7-like [Chironomus tepperi]|uniref:PHD finger protein 7-like n=1 Tax=Chironomus tepperi TaxID=113505 RepID=UPI00391F009C